MKIGVLGGTGNVGQCVVRHLLSLPGDQVQQVILVNRRAANAGEVPADSSRIVEHIVDMSPGVDVEPLFAEALAQVDVLVSTIGLGSGKSSLETFRWVEVELATAFATAGKQVSAKKALLLTSSGADIDSEKSWLLSSVAGGLFFHLKGQVEKNFSDIGFEQVIHIFRPAGLLGTQHVPAVLDHLMPAVDWLAPKTWRSIHIEKLGFAMATVAVRSGDSSASVIYQDDDLFALTPGKRWQKD